MRDITLLQPQKIVFGTGCIKRFTEDFLALGHHRLMVVTLPFIRPMLKEMTDTLAAHGVDQG